MNGEKYYRLFSSIESKRIDWLWYPYIPAGRITLLQGDPGNGKSTFILNVAAAVTKGDILPGANGITEIGNVIYQCSEDGLADTVKPRLVSAGADCNRIAYIVSDEQGLTVDDMRILEAVDRFHAKLLIIDPLQEYLSSDVSLQNAQGMRAVLSRISNVAHQTGCAVVLVCHLNKSSSNNSLYRGLGSIDITAIARSVLMIARDPLHHKTRYMIPVKTSLAPEGKPIEFTIDRDGFKWIGESDIDGVTVLNPEKNSYRGKRQWIFLRMN